MQNFIALRIKNKVVQQVILDRTIMEAGGDVDVGIVWFFIGK